MVRVRMMRSGLKTNWRVFLVNQMRMDANELRHQNNGAEQNSDGWGEALHSCQRIHAWR